MGQLFSKDPEPEPVELPGDLGKELDNHEARIKELEKK